MLSLSGVTGVSRRGRKPLAEGDSIVGDHVGPTTNYGGADSTSGQPVLKPRESR